MSGQVDATTWGARDEDRASGSAGNTYGGEGQAQFPPPPGSGPSSGRESPIAGDYNRVCGPDLHVQQSGLEVDSFLLRGDTRASQAEPRAERHDVVAGDEVTLGE